jgi:Amidohydrolase
MSDTRGVTEVSGVQEFRYFAGGEWRAAQNNKLFDVYRPFDRRLYAVLQLAGVQKRPSQLTKRKKPSQRGREPALQSARGCSPKPRRSSSGAASRLPIFWRSRRGAPYRPQHSSKTWWSRPSSRRLGGCTFRRAKSCQECPDRFGGFAALPLPDVDGALRKLEYGLDVLKLDGVVLFSNARGIYLGDARYRPLFAELERRAAVVFVHPTASPAPAARSLGLPDADRFHR